MKRRGFIGRMLAAFFTGDIAVRSPEFKDAVFNVKRQKPELPTFADEVKALDAEIEALEQTSAAAPMTTADAYDAIDWDQYWMGAESVPYLSTDGPWMRREPPLKRSWPVCSYCTTPGRTRHQQRCDGCGAPLPVRG